MQQRRDLSGYAVDGMSGENHSGRKRNHQSPLRLNIERHLRSFLDDTIGANVSPSRSHHLISGLEITSPLRMT
jgi:hypothetical protein